MVYFNVCIYGTMILAIMFSVLKTAKKKKEDEMQNMFGVPLVQLHSGGKLQL